MEAGRRRLAGTSTAPKRLTNARLKVRLTRRDYPPLTALERFRPAMTRSPRLASFIASYVLLFVTTIACAALPPGVTQGPSVEGITEYTLANGLKVLLFPEIGRAHV